VIVIFFDKKGEIGSPRYLGRLREAFAARSDPLRWSPNGP
jgi:hypothetical protein